MARRRSGRSFNYRKKQGGWTFLGSGLSDWGNLALQLYGAYNARQGAKSAGKTADRASAAEDNLLNTQSDLAVLNEARAQEMYDEYMDTAQPAMREVLDLAKKPINPNVEAATAGADYALADATQRGTRARALQSRGVDPSSGAALESDRLALLDSTAGRAGAMTGARRGATDRRIARIQNAAQQFNPLIGATSSFSAQANSGLSSVAGAQGRNADQATEIAGNAGQQFGESLTGISDQVQRMWSNYKKPKPAVQVQP